MHADLVHLTAGITIPLGVAGAVLMMGFLITLFALRDRPVGKFLCKLASFAGFTAMLAVAGVSPLRPTPAMDQSLTFVLISVFKIVWWLAASWLLIGLVRAGLVFQRKPRETRFLQDLFAGVSYVGAVLGIVAYVFDTAVSGLLAASGVIAIVLGLALQSTLGDVFSGIVLNLAKPYRPGDWVTLDGGPEGRVIETNWRATQILTLWNDLAVVPNSLIAKGKLVNASQPDRAHGITIVVRLDPAVAPSSGIAVLETALLGCTRILRLPAATVAVRSLDALALECELRFFVGAIEYGPQAQNEVFDRVFRHCLSRGLRLAPPAGSGVTLPPRGLPLEPADEPRRILELLPIFASLSGEERLLLAPKMTRRIYDAGDVIVEQGVVAPALFILTSGVLSALQQHDGHDVEVLRFAPGDCLCQASVMTSAVTTFKVVALTRSALYQIPTNDIAPILTAQPGIAAELSQIIARREAAGRTKLLELEVGERYPGHLAGRLADRMKLLFGLG